MTTTDAPASGTPPTTTATSTPASTATNAATVPATATPTATPETTPAAADEQAREGAAAVAKPTPTTVEPSTASVLAPLDGTSGSAAVDDPGSTTPAGPVEADVDPTGIAARAGVDQPAPSSTQRDGDRPMTAQQREHARAATTPIDLDDPASVLTSTDYWFDEDASDPSHFVVDGQGRMFERVSAPPGVRLEGEWLDADGSPVAGPVHDGTVSREVREYGGELDDPYTVSTEWITYEDGIVVAAGTSGVGHDPIAGGTSRVDVVSGTDDHGRAYTTASTNVTDANGIVLVQDTTTTTVAQSDASGAPSLLVIERAGLTIVPGHGRLEHASTVHVGDGTSAVDGDTRAVLVQSGERWIGDDGTVLANLPVVDESGTLVGGVVQPTTPHGPLQQHPPIVGAVEWNDDGSVHVDARVSSHPLVDTSRGSAYIVPEEPSTASRIANVAVTIGSALALARGVTASGSVAAGRLGTASTMLSYASFLSGDPMSAADAALTGTSPRLGPRQSALVALAGLLVLGEADPEGDDPRPAWVQLREAFEEWHRSEPSTTVA
jgi:hypothetical protein